jgi:hypothetical protein
VSSELAQVTLDGRGVDGLNRPGGVQVALLAPSEAQSPIERLAHQRMAEQVLIPFFAEQPGTDRFVDASSNTGGAIRNISLNTKVHRGKIPERP